MAFGFKINGAFLDLLPGSKLRFERNNDIYATGDPTLLEASYSFPIEIPLTAHNRKLLRYPDLVDAMTPLVSEGGCALYIGDGQSLGMPMFTGRLYVKRARSSPHSPRASVFMVTEGLNEGKDTTFDEVDLGKYEVAAPVNMAGVMKDGTIYPLDYPFVFFPVRNEQWADMSQFVTDDFVGDPTGWAYQNYYRTDIDHFVNVASDTKNMILTPFLRLQPLVQKCIELLGYTMDDQLFTDEEMQLLCLYNNVSIYDPDTVVPTEIRYNAHVPRSMGVVEFVKKVARNFWCGIFTDTVTKTISIVPLRYVLDRPHRHDWTEKAAEEYDTMQDNGVPKRVGYATDGADGYFGYKYTSPEVLLAEITFDVDGIRYYWPSGTQPLYKYFKRDNRYMVLAAGASPGGWKTLLHRMEGVNTGGRGDAWASEVIPLFAYYNGARYLTPICNMRGTGRLKLGSELVEQTQDMQSIRIVHYRGRRAIETGHVIPYASCNAYDPTNEDDTFGHSLLYDGPANMHDRWAAQWLLFMDKKRIIKRRFNLKARDIMNLKEWDKVRVGSTMCFVKSMSIEVGEDGIDPVDCELVTIPIS